MEPESKVAETPRGRKKIKRSKKKAKKDPNEPQKPISAYALFFRDTQATIKSQNADVTFGEVSKIVAAMWDSLDPDSKNVYKEKNEAAKKEYLKALAAYRASLTEKMESNIGEVSSTCLEPSSPIAPTTIEPSSSPQAKSPISTVQEDMTNLALETPVKLTEAHLTQQDPCQTVNTISSSEEQGDIQESEPSISNGTETTEVKICLRSGCMNPAIDSPEWDQEYCSSKCVVEHCSNVFMAHVAARQKSTTEQS